MAETPPNDAQGNARKKRASTGDGAKRWRSLAECEVEVGTGARTGTDKTTSLPPPRRRGGEDYIHSTVDQLPAFNKLVSHDPFRVNRV